MQHCSPFTLLGAVLLLITAASVVSATTRPPRRRCPAGRVGARSLGRGGGMETVVCKLHGDVPLQPIGHERRYWAKFSTN